MLSNQEYRLQPVEHYKVLYDLSRIVLDRHQRTNAFHDAMTADQLKRVVEVTAIYDAVLERIALSFLNME